MGSEEEFGQFAKEIKGEFPETFLLANMTEFGKTPIIPLETFKSLKYDCVIYPVSTLRIAQKAIDLFLDSLIENGHVEKTLENMLTRKELYELLKYKPGEQWTYPNSMESDDKI